MNRKVFAAVWLVMHLGHSDGTGRAEMGRSFTLWERLF